ncbi:MAG: substrate-binding domain-containing protein [Geobacteraceae bacterium]
MKLFKAASFSLVACALALFTVFVPSTSQAAPAVKSLILATTTSTQDSGLLDVLIPMFEKQTGYMVKTIAVGSGQAMKMGERGEADVLLVHSPAAEEKFMAEGYGITRKIVMHNDFVIVGPPSDPAKIKEATSTEGAFKNIAESKSLFVSRGDNSGTNAKELKIWKKIGIDPAGQKWYQPTGLGMGQTLNVASEKNGYTLTDRATYLAFKKNLSLVILKQGDPILLNVYHVIELNPAKSPKINIAGGKAFADFMLAKKTQAVIGKFGIAKYGSPLFFADAGKKE